MEETLQHRDFRNPGQPSCAAASGADVSGATVWVSEAQLRNRQKPTDEDAGKWITLSANLILDGHNCAWVMQYPHQPLAGGSMYACICLHIFAPAGSAGGAPLPTAYRLAAHLLIYAASSPTQTSLTNSQKSWSGFKQHFAAITSRKRLLRSLPGNAHCLVLLDSCV